MIKRLLAIAILLFSVQAYAQKPSFVQKISYGFKIGGGLADQYVKGVDIVSTSTIKTFNASVFGQIPLEHDIWLRAGVGFAGKGSVISVDALTTTTQLGYIEVPITLIRKFNFTNLGRFYIGAGGYFASGLAGTVDFETPGSNTSDKLTFGAENDLKRLDLGVNFLTGFEFRNKLMFNINYALGLNNIASTNQQNSGTSVVKNRVFSIGLGYLIK